MKKLLFILVLLLVSVFTINVNASSAPYHWYPNGGGEQLPEGATEEIDGKTVILKLNNYNGKGLHIECRGTGQEGMTFVIELTGENTITDDSKGLELNYGGKIEFKGEGSLKINAPKPISYESYENTMIINPSKNVYTDKEETEEIKESNETNDDTKLISTKDDDTKKDTDNKKDYIIYIIFGTYALISLIIISVLAIKLSKKNA